MNEEKSKYIGKYVCYNSIDGGACWGRIKMECKVNTMSGEKDAFVLENRIVAHQKANSGMTVKVFPLGGAVASKTMSLNPDTNQLGDDLEVKITHIKGDSVIRQDVIDMDRDIIDLAAVWGRFTEDQLFLALLCGKESGYFGNRALDLGLVSFLGSEKGVQERVKQEIESRMEKRTDG